MARSGKAVEKAVKKTHKGTLLLALLFLIVGAAAGAAAAWFLTKNDCFTLNGEKQIELALGQTYEEQGAVAVSFGKDISDKIAISGDEVDTTADGVYRVVYTVDDVRWGEYRLVRTVVVGNGGEGGAQ